MHYVLSVQVFYDGLLYAKETNKLTDVLVHILSHLYSSMLLCTSCPYCFILSYLKFNLNYLTFFQGYAGRAFAFYHQRTNLPCMRGCLTQSGKRTQRQERYNDCVSNFYEYLLGYTLFVSVILLCRVHWHARLRIVPRQIKRDDTYTHAGWMMSLCMCARVKRYVRRVSVTPVSWNGCWAEGNFALYGVGR